MNIYFCILELYISDSDVIMALNDAHDVSSTTSALMFHYTVHFFFGVCCVIVFISFMTSSKYVKTLVSIFSNTSKQIKGLNE